MGKKNDWFRLNKKPEPEPEPKPLETGDEQLAFIERNYDYLATLGWEGWLNVKKPVIVNVFRATLPNKKVLPGWTAMAFAYETIKNNPKLKLFSPSADTFLRLYDPEKGIIVVTEFGVFFSQNQWTLLRNLGKPPEIYDSINEKYWKDLKSASCLAEATFPYDSWFMEPAAHKEYYKDRLQRFEKETDNLKLEAGWYFRDAIPEPDTHIHDLIQAYQEPVAGIALNGYKEKGRGAVVIFRFTKLNGRIIPKDWGMKYLSLNELFKLLSELPQSGVLGFIDKYDPSHEMVVCTYYPRQSIFWGLHLEVSPHLAASGLEFNSPVHYGAEALNYFPTFHDWLVNFLAGTQSPDDLFFNED